MKKTYKCLKIIAAIFIFSALLPAISFCKQQKMLTVKTYLDEDLKENINVAVIALSTSEYNGGPVSQASDIKITDSNGIAEFVAYSTYNYHIIASTHGASPTAMQQMKDLYYGTFIFPGEEEKHELPHTSTITLNTLDPSKNLNGRLNLNIINVSTDALCFSELINEHTGDPVAFGIGKATCSFLPLYIDNIPIPEQKSDGTMYASSGTYRLSIFSPGENKGIEGKLLEFEINEIELTEVGIDFSNASSLETTHSDEQDITQESSIKGVVTSTNGVYISDAIVTVSEQNSNNTEEIKVFTDENGYYSIYDLMIGSTYVLKCFKQGFVGREFGNIKYDGGEHYIPIEMDKVNSTGTVKGRIFSHFPGADVFLEVDYSSWPEVGVNAGKCSARILTDKNGRFEFKKIPQGNYNLIVKVPGIAKENIFNYGGNGVEDFDIQNDNIKLRKGDDRRLFVDEYGYGVVCSTDPNNIVIDNSQDELIPVLAVIPKSTQAVISGSIHLDQDIETIEPIIIFVYPEENIENQIYFDTVAFYSSGTKSYNIQVPTGTYIIEIKHDELSPAEMHDFKVRVTTSNPEYFLPDIEMVKGGKIGGIIRDPQGKIITRKEYSDGKRREIEIDIHGVDVPSGGGAMVDSQGEFLSSSLAPGLYNITARVLLFDPNSYEPEMVYPPISLSEIKIRSGEECKVELYAKQKANTEFIVPQPPEEPVGYTGGKFSYWIIGIPFGQKIDGHYIQKLTSYKENPEIPIIAYKMDTKEWNKPLITSGKYNFYEVYTQLFGWKGEYFMEGMPRPNPHEFITVLSRAENKNVLTSNTTNYVEFGAGTMGNKTISGKVSGDNLFTEGDMDEIKGNLMEFLNVVPTFMLYDTEGDFVGYSAARPGSNSEEAKKEWDSVIMNPSVKKFDILMDTYPIKYRIESIPVGDYILIGESPNYPPVTKKISLSEDTVVDINFDHAEKGSSIYGIVKDTSGAVINGASIYFSHNFLGDKTGVTGNAGSYNLAGLPGGIYRMTAHKSGYARSGRKIHLGTDDEKEVNFVLKRASAWIQGRVYAQKYPSPKYLKNATVMAYNESFNVANPSAYLPVHRTKTDTEGFYFIEDLLAGDTYKIFVYSKGRRFSSTSTVVGDNTRVNFELPKAPPKVKISMKRTSDPREFDFFIESPKKIQELICYYNPGDTFDSSEAVRALPVEGPNNTYNVSVKVSGDFKYYYFRTEATSDMINIQSSELVFSPVAERNSKHEIDVEIAQGGDINLDRFGKDFSGVYIDPASIEPTSTKSGMSVCAIGGFYTALPVFNLNRTGVSNSASLSDKLSEIAVSDVYEVNLEDAQMNKKISLSLNYDIEKVEESEINDLRIYGFNEDEGEWEKIPGAVSVNPVKGTVSCDIASVNEPASWTEASGLNAPANAGRTVVEDGKFVVNEAAATSQSSKFAVFKSDPALSEDYTGDKFIIYNFPNPFDLNKKTVTKEHVTAQQDAEIEGTMITYALPDQESGEVDFYIYNLAGELVRKLKQGDTTGGYYYYANWDGRNDRGEKCASGVYFLIAKIDGKKLNNEPYKMAILK
ncbi:MAG: carboxypeptidase regulatory-like domain-containing protein [Elusimicrobiota bacterium]